MLFSKYSVGQTKLVCGPGSVCGLPCYGKQEGMNAWLLRARSKGWWLEPRNDNIGAYMEFLSDIYGNRSKKKRIPL